jgi:translation initiation factor IF-2
MSNSTNDKKEKSLDLSKTGKLSLSKTLDTSRMKAIGGNRGSKPVTVEVRRTRGGTPTTGRSGGPTVEVKRRVGDNAQENAESLGGLSEEERNARMQALKMAEVEAERRKEEEARRKVEEEERRKVEEERRKREEEEERLREKERLELLAKEPDTPAAIPAAEKEDRHAEKKKDHVEEEDAASKHAKAKAKFIDEEADRNKNAKIRLKQQEPRRGGRLTITQALDFGEERQRSLASVKRQREKAKRHDNSGGEQDKVYREVVLPETISVQDLANRMSERVVDVTKALMKMGTMATAAQMIDADTAELIANDMGHTVKRVTDADVENVLLANDKDDAAKLVSRAPVVTIMGHVDHGKTSLLDALRKTDVAAGEAGGITQHIGAYQVSLSNGQKISFLDTPGHEAFTAMRLRGAKVTDVVVLVVAADDGVREQTVEAINHARAAEVPMIIAINKIDKEGADPTRVKTELMSYEIVTEDMGGDTIAVEVSAKQGMGLDALEEAILLQSEIMELKANPNRLANGAVIEAKVDKGRGALATLLVQRGTLKIGDIVVAGAAYGRVRAIVDDKGNTDLQEAGPSMPVEILGLNQAPEAGDEFAVVESERIARDITEYRAKKIRDQRTAAAAPTLEQLFTNASSAKAKELPVIIKGDVQGSVEAIIGSITKYSNEEVKVRVLHSGVGAISESDVSLANASNALMIAFNVRANNQAREMARSEGTEIRYYSVIYDVVDDIKAALGGMLSPEQRETMIGYARIDQVFSVTKVGKVAGCVVTEGTIKRGCKVRLLRDNVVIHDGALKTLKRFKDEVKEVKNGQECGMAFENYDDIREGDMIEAYEVEEVARTVD